jgi:hypothetical protein
VRDHYEKGDIDMHHIDTQNQVIDIFTKPLDQAPIYTLARGAWSLFPFIEEGNFGCCILVLLFFVA